MAQLATPIIDVLSVGFNIVNPAYFSTVISSLKNLSVASTLVAAIFNFLVPSPQHREIIMNFNKLHREIANVRRDIVDLEHHISWQTTIMQYGELTTRITTGMRYCQLIEEYRLDRNTQIEYENHLQEICDNKDMTVALNLLINGITRRGTFSSSILDNVYEYTNGNYTAIGAMSQRLLTLVLGGMMVVLTNERIQRGAESANRLEQDMFAGKKQDIVNSINAAFQRCKDNFKENVLNDIERRLSDGGGSNSPIANQLYHDVNTKYGWEDFSWTVLVYDDIRGFKRHSFSGIYVFKLHFHGKCGIVFYSTGSQNWRDKAKAQSLAEKYGSQRTTSLPPKRCYVFSRVKRCFPAESTADTCNRELQRGLKNSNVPYGSVGCWDRHIDLVAVYNSNLVWAVESEYTVAVML